MSTEPTPSEQALNESLASRESSDSLIAEAEAVFGFFRTHRKKNHYADKVRLVFRGAS